MNITQFDFRWSAKSSMLETSITRQFIFCPNVSINYICQLYSIQSNSNLGSYGDMIGSIRKVYMKIREITKWEWFLRFERYEELFASIHPSNWLFIPSFSEINFIIYVFLVYSTKCNGLNCGGALRSYELI